METRPVARMLSLVAVLAAAMLASASAAGAQGIPAPLNDVGALSQGDGQTPVKAAVQRPAEPTQVAAPRADCAPGTKTEPGIQGRIPAGAANDGLRCNVTQISHQGLSGGFKVFRYTDDAGHECAFYDTALTFPLNALQFSGQSLGVAVLDMTDHAHPVQTATLTELPFLSPHESLNLNVKRGLIAAVLGNPSTYPGLVSIYDAHADCRHPVLQSTALVARLGHESGFSQDGKTFYATGTASTPITATPSITAIDVSDPKAPHPVWQGNVGSHGMSLSNDGNRAYIADNRGDDMLILDTSEIQARKPNPQTREISRLTWRNASIPQNAIPFTEKGHPYVLEFDEFTAGTPGRSGDKDSVGAGRIIDISDEKAPRVVSNLRLQVNQKADHAAAAGDPGANNPGQGYAAHYCNIPTRVDPKVVACSFITSGLRVFDITGITAPKEIAYFVAPPQPRLENGYMASDYAMSQPAFDADQQEIWYSDGASGFYDVRVNDAVWPKTAKTGPASVCASNRRFLVAARAPRGARVRSVRATLAGKPIKTTRQGRNVHVRFSLRGQSRGTVRLIVRIGLRDGRTTRTVRTYRHCRRRA